MIRKYHGMVVIFMLLLVLGTEAGANTAQVINAYITKIRIITEGREVVPTLPILSYKGSTYVPLRFLGEAVGKTVVWKPDTKTVWIGEQPKENFTYLTKLPRGSVQGQAWEVMDDWNKKEGMLPPQIGGIIYQNAWYLRFWFGTNFYAREFITEGKYKQITGFLGIDDYTINSERKAQIRIFGDGIELYASPVLSAGERAQNFSLDITRINRIKFEIQVEGVSDDQLAVSLAEVKLFD